MLSSDNKKFLLETNPESVHLIDILIIHFIYKYFKIIKNKYYKSSLFNFPNSSKSCTNSIGL